MTRRTWAWYLAIGGLAVVLHVPLAPGLGRDLFGVVVSSSAVVAVALGLRAHPRTPRVPWVLLAVGYGMWITGDLIWAVLAARGLDPFPSVADVFYLAAYVVLAVGLQRLAHARRPQGDVRSALDALIVGVGVGFVLLVVFIEPAWQSEDSLVARIVAAAYPIGDVMLLVLMTHLRGSGRGRTPALRYLSLGLAFTLAADLLFQSAPYLPWVDDRVVYIDELWLLGYLFFGAAALHPSIVRASAAQPLTYQPTSLTGGQLGLISMSLGAGPVVLAVEVITGATPHLLQAAIAGTILVVLIHLRLLGMTREMTRQRERLALLAESDALTGLANLRRFSEEVEQRLLDDRVSSVPVLLVALDRYTEINETLGQRVGDELLRAVASRVRSIVGDHGVVARTGGDTFGVVVEEDRQCAEDVTECATRLRAGLVEPFRLSDVTVSIDALVGVAVGPEDGETVDELMQRADVAVSVARNRPDRVARYSGRMSFDATFAPHLVGELSQALENRDIVVHYQPKVAVATGRVTGAEALVRWQHPVHGLLPPGAFIPAAERTGLIRPLTLYVLERALEQVGEWRAAGHRMHVSVNLSVRDLLDPGFVSDVEGAVIRSGVGWDALELEITETMAMVDPERSLGVLRGLAGLGVLLSVDDYGTGYSSLAYLQRMPVKRLKIDRQFVQGVVEDRASAAIVRSTVELAKHLGMTVVAEGVEDDATLLALKEMGCDSAQGFGLGRPVPAEAFLPLVELIEERVPRVLVQRVPVGRRVV